MRATSKIIAEFVGVFVVGAAAGALLMYCYTDTQLTSFMSHTTDPDNLVARINKKYSDTYHLTPDEIAKIQPQIKEMSQKLYQERHQFGVDIVSTFADYHKQIADQLTPEHKDAYVKAVGDRDAKLKALLLPDQASPQQGGK